MLDHVGEVIVKRRTGYIADGHLRVELALERGDGPSDSEQLRELLLNVDAADEAVRSLVGEIARRAGVSLDLHEVDDQDAEEQSSRQPVTQRGDLWKLGAHRLLCGDSTIPADVERLMHGEQAHLLATDPPYLVDYDRANHPGSTSEGPESWDCFRGAEEAVSFFAGYLEAALPHLVRDAPIYQWYAHRRHVEVEQAWQRAGLLLHQVLIWSKTRAVPGHSHFAWQHEPCLYGWVKGEQPGRRPPPNATTVWEVEGEPAEDGPRHPTQKPVELFARPIAWHTLPGEICLEPFAGGGSQILAAERQGRRCYALELDEQYVDRVIKRWQRSTGGQALHDGDERTFDSLREMRHGG